MARDAAGRDAVEGSPRPRRMAWRATLALALCAAVALTGSGMLRALQPAPRPVAPATPTAVPTRTPPHAELVAPAGLAPTRRDAALGCAPDAPAPLALPVRGGPYGGTVAPNEVALTFDDGPVTQTSNPIIDELEATGTPATFFVQGLYVRAMPDVLRREWASPLFAIGVHTWDHPFMTRQSDAQLAHQFGDTIAQLRAIMGAHACLWLWRPPYGDYNAHVLRVAASYGLTTVLWDAAGADWVGYNAPVIAATVLAGLHPGAIILLHDGVRNSYQTYLALPAILAGLRARGLRPVTLPQLLADCHYPGIAPIPPPA